MNSAQVVGGLACSAILGAGAVYFLIRAWKSDERSARWANVSLFCGLSFMCFPESALGLLFEPNGIALRISGSIRLLLGLCGVILGVRALRRRHQDHAVSAARPITGIVLSGFHGLVGLGLILLAPYFSLPTGETAWTYNSPNHGYSLTLPSSAWREARMKDGTFAFVDPVHRMHAGIQAHDHAPDEASFQKAVGQLRDYVKGSAGPSQSPIFREGVNEHGNPYFYATSIDSSDAARTEYVAMVLCWRKQAGQIVRVIFEAPLQMTSREGREAEMRMIKQAADTICLSIE